MNKIIIRYVMFIALLFSCNTLAHKVPHSCGSENLICRTSIPELLIYPHKYSGKGINVAGYIHIVDNGPNSGYWLSMYKDGFDLSSVVRVELAENAPQKSWLEDGAFVRVTALLEACDGINCNSRLTPLNGKVRLIPNMK